MSYKTYAVIMAGGVGSRFWPSSRAKSPKQLLDLTRSGRTMIAATVDRVGLDIPPERVIVVTGSVTLEEVRAALPEVPPENILAEPQGRNTAPCIGWAATLVAKRDPNGILAVMPSDHLVADQGAFRDAFVTAVEAAAAGDLVTFGIRPHHPETGFGYIELGPDSGAAVRDVARFVEKPDSTTAEQYVSAGNYVWNSGMFFFSARRILDEIDRQMPDLAAGLKEIGAAIGTQDERGVVERVFPSLPSQSIDYGIMEGASGIRCVQVDFGWSDLGSWAAAYELSPKDSDGSTFDGDVVAVASRGCLVRAPSDKLVALVGVEDLVIVDTGDALLVCKRGEAQDVKKVVDALGKRGRADLL